MQGYKISIIVFLATVSCIAFSFNDAKAISVGESVSFYVDKNYETSSLETLDAVLVKTYPNLYVYIEKGWWNAQDVYKKDEIIFNIDNLSNEFDGKIYPMLTSTFGQEPRPGIDNDAKVTLLFHAMGRGATGYVRSNDEYSRLEVPDSNQREMIYLNTNNIADPLLKSFLAHEFIHLITFNQKDRMHGLPEEVWLNEARAEYVSTLLGYDDVYQGSALQKRVGDFLQKPDDSLTEWKGTQADYGIITLFVHYLVDQYGIRVLKDSLKLKSVGIESINETLLGIGAEEDFSEVFSNWTIAMAVNNCSVGPRYCYKNNNLKNLRLNPPLIFLPFSGSVSLSINNFTKSWAGNWQKIVGGNGNVRLRFSTSSELGFEVPYVLTDKANNSSVAFLSIGQSNAGEITIENFSNVYNSLIIIPSLHIGSSKFNNAEISYPYDLAISTSGVKQSGEETLIQELLAKIEDLKRKIAALQGAATPQNSCESLNNNLYVGVVRSSEVTCLQQFLKNQGSDIYPEGLVTGYFGNLTKSAVIKFQKKYSIMPTGYVGVLTRTKINQLLSS